MMGSSTESLIIDSWKLPIVSAVVCVAVSVTVAGAQILINQGFGASDLIPFIVWTVPLNILVALAKRLVSLLVNRRGLALKYFVFGLLGFVGALLWTFTVAAYFGPNFGAFSFPVLPCWMVGAASGLMVGLNRHSRFKQWMLIDLGIVLALCVGVFTVYRTLPHLTLDSHSLEVVAVKWTPGSQTLTNPLVLGQSLSERDFERIKAIGLTGRVEYAGSGVFGKGKRSRLIIIISHQLKEPVDLRQPDGAEVVYVQNDDGWKMHPPNAKTLRRVVQLRVDQRDPNRVTMYSVENADQTRQGGTLATW